MKKLVIFDICGTLYQSNTTYDFLLFYFKKVNSTKYYRIKLFQSLPAKIFWKGLTILGFSSAIRKMYINQLKGEPVAQVEKKALIFVDQFLEDRKIQFSQNQLKKYKEEKNTSIIFASASVEPVVKAIVEKLEINNYFCTILECKDGCYTGKIKVERQGKKWAAVKAWKEKNLHDYLVFFTDNKEDLALARKADEVTIVAKDKNRPYWCEKLKEHPSFKLIKV